MLFGCGDLLNDYEGIRGYEEFRPDLSFLYFVEYDGQRRELARLELVPMRMRRFRLESASSEDAAWLYDTLTSAGGWPGAEARLDASGTIVVAPR